MNLLAASVLAGYGAQRFFRGGRRRIWFVVAGARRVLAGTRLSTALSYSRYDPKVHKDYRTKIANLIRGNRQQLPVELFRVVLRPVIAVAVLVIALFFTRRSRRRSTNSFRSRGVPTPGVAAATPG